MFDFSFGEIAVIGAVALVVLGPERLPKVARTVGEWAGKAQRYVAQVKSDINREIELAELKKLQEQARDVAQSFESSVRDNISGLQSELDSTAKSLNANLGASTTDASAGTTDYAWENVPEPPKTYFARRYKPSPSIYDLSEEIARLKRQLAMPGNAPSTRHKRGPRARVNKVRVRR